MRPPPLRHLAVFGSVLLAACIREPVSIDPPLTDEFAGELLGPSVSANGRPFGLAVSSTGTVAFTRQDVDSVSLFSTASTTVALGTLTDDNPGDVIFTADGSHLFVSAFNAGTIHEINASTGAVTRSLPLAGNAYRLALSANGSRLFVTTVDGKLYSVNTTTFVTDDSLALGGSLQGIARHPTSGLLAVGSTGGTVYLVDPTTLDVTLSVAAGAKPQEVVFSPDGSLLFVAREESPTVLLYNATTLALVDSIELAAEVQPFGMAISPDGQILLVGSPLSGRLAVASVATRSVIRTLTVPSPRRIGFSADGTRAFVSSEANLVLRLR